MLAVKQIPNQIYPRLHSVTGTLPERAFRMATGLQKRYARLREPVHELGGNQNGFSQVNVKQIKLVYAHIFRIVLYKALLKCGAQREEAKSLTRYLLKLFVEHEFNTMSRGDIAKFWAGVVIPEEVRAARLAKTFSEVFEGEREQIKEFFSPSPYGAEFYLTIHACFSLRCAVIRLSDSGI